MTITVIVAFVLVGILVGVDGERDDRSTSEPTAPARYASSIDAVLVLNPASVEVIATVRNIGGTSGRPDCTVRASDPSGVYRGFDMFTLRNSIPPRGQDVFRGTIVITNEGASYVTDAEIECE